MNPSLAEKLSDLAVKQLFWFSVRNLKAVPMQTTLLPVGEKWEKKQEIDLILETDQLKVSLPVCCTLGDLLRVVVIVQVSKGSASRFILQVEL